MVDEGQVTEPMVAIFVHTAVHGLVARISQWDRVGAGYLGGGGTCVLAGAPSQSRRYRGSRNSRWHQGIAKCSPDHDSAALPFLPRSWHLSSFLPSFSASPSSVGTSRRRGYGNTPATRLAKGYSKADNIDRNGRPIAQSYLYRSILKNTRKDITDENDAHKTPNGPSYHPFLATSSQSFLSRLYDEEVDNSYLDVPGISRRGEHLLDLYVMTTEYTTPILCVHTPLVFVSSVPDEPIPPTRPSYPPQKSLQLIWKTGNEGPDSRALLFQYLHSLDPASVHYACHLDPSTMSSSLTPCFFASSRGQRCICPSPSSLRHPRVATHYST
ncbi:hypothetical protein ARMGADRAFT_1091719 [Armillaria gallica]|uniref:Uncharacterized protein n=1 Tax=Armillaria gallica TaxID=47427 RepID=A0A2H3CD13_ARMGA|nr:hypothetical protein ARMGADRAFT_1091719 [Armillaria gallica]